MNTDYENRGQRINAENRLQKEEDWPRLVVPEFTNKNHERRYAGTGTQKQHTERPKSGYTTERTVKSKSGDKAKRTVRPKSGRTTSRAVRTKRMRADSTREILTKIKEAAAKSANLKTLAGFSENQSGKSILKKTKHIFLFPLVFIYFEILLRIFGGTGVLNHFIYPVLFGIAAGLFAACITTLFRKKVNRIITAVILFATGLLFIVECLIKDSFQVYMTFKSILSGAGGVMGEFRSELINSIVFGIPVILLFFLPGILYLIFGKKKLPTRRQKRPFSAMVLAGAAVFMLIASLTASIGSSKAQYKTQYDFNTATQYFGLMTSVRLDGKYALFGNKQGDTLGFETTSADTDKKVEEDKAEEAVPEKKEYGDNVSDLDFAALSESASDETIRNMHAYVNSQTPSKQNDYTGLFEGKNLIMICAEAFSDVVINKELTPTLYRLTHNGIYFSEYYQPTWGGSTSSGEYSFLTGLAPVDGVKAIQETKGNNMYYTMGNQLQRKGYLSQAYHNGEHDFYSRHETHENLGFDKFIALGQGLEEIAGEYPPDELFFDKTMDTYIDQQPFNIYYMTISGHCIYKTGNVKVKENIDAIKAAYGDKYKQTTMNYFCYQQELEKALTTMVKKLEDAGIADDTVICMTSDHYPYGLEKTSTFKNNEDYVSDLYGYKPANSWEKDHNSWIIWSGCLENEQKDMACEISTPTYSLDILPTLSNLFGLEYDSRLLVGRDVFSDAEPLVLWTNYSWVTDKGKYDSGSGEFYPNEGVTVGDDYVDNMKTIVKNKLTYSQQALKNDYFGVLFGKK